MPNGPQGTSADTEAAPADTGVLKPFIEGFYFLTFFLERDRKQQGQVMIVGGYGGFGII